MLGRRSQSHELIPYDPELENTLRYLHRDKNKQDTLPIKMGDELELNNLTRPLKDFKVPKALDQPSCIAYLATTTTFEIKSGSIHLVNACNHPYHNPLSKPRAFVWLGPT